MNQPAPGHRETPLSDETIQRLVFAKQVDLVFRLTPLTLVAALICLVVMGLVLYLARPGVHLYVWFAGSVFMLSTGFILCDLTALSAVLDRWLSPETDNAEGTGRKMGPEAIPSSGRLLLERPHHGDEIPIG